MLKKEVRTFQTKRRAHAKDLIDVTVPAVLETAGTVSSFLSGDTAW